MTPEELDRILSSEETLEPSSGFASKSWLPCAGRLKQPAPLRFPWWRFAAGIAASGGMAVGATVLLLQSDVLSAPVLPPFR